MSAAVTDEVKAAERSVLGAMLVRSSVIPDVADILEPGDYYHPAHEAIHEAIVARWNRKEPVDMVTVAGELGPETLQKIGGAPYLHTLASEVPIAANATYYAEQVRDAALGRRLVDAGTRIVQRAQTGGDMVQVAEDARRIVDEAASSAATREAGITAGAGMDAALEWLEAPPVGAETPWPDVNDVTNGVLAGQLVTVAGRPGHGKSLVAKDAAVFTAKHGRPVHIATLEMSRNEYLARILAAEAKVNLGNMLRRQMSDAEWQAVADASAKVRKLPIYLDDREYQSVAQIRAAARQTMRRYDTDLGLIAIDYLQLVRPRDRRLPREQQVAEISRECKLLAKEFGCPVLLLAQLNRGNTARTDHTPMVSDLRESGAIEQDSDQVWLLHRADQYDGGEDRLGEVDLIVGKNRNGPAPVTVTLAFQGHYGRIVSMV